MTKNKERFSKKVCYDGELHYCYPPACRLDQEHLEWTGQLEDIEEELGIDLITREKALQNGAWYKSHSRGIVFCPFVRIVGKGKALELKEGQRTATLCANPCDYGKTWALTREELE